MNWVDYAILAVVAISTVAGLLRGFTREILSLVTWIAAFWLAWRYGPVVAVHLGRVHFGQAGEGLRLYIGYALIFIAVLIIGALLAAAFVKLVRSGPLIGPDRTLGGGIGLLRGLLIVVTAVMLATVGGERGSASWRQSMLVPHLVPLADGLRAYVPRAWLAPLTQREATASSQASKDG